MVLLNNIGIGILVSLTVNYAKCNLNFKKNLPEICLDCIKTLQKNTCVIPSCELGPDCKNKIDLNNFVAKNKDRPTLLCREDNTLTFRWNHTKHTYYFIEYFSEGVNDSKITSLTHCNFQTITGLNPNQKYEVRLFSYSVDSNILFTNQKLIGFTTKVSASKTSVENLSYSLTLDNESWKARITWKPGPDISCLYEIIWYEKVPTGSYLLRRIDLKKQLISEFNMSNLNFGKKYDVAVMSIDRNGEKESAKKWMHITIPTCLDATKNISICPPNIPKNLTLSRYLDNQTDATNASNFINLKLTWNIPKFLPNYYNATLISNMGNLTEEFSYISKNVSGSNNWVTFKKLKPTLFYRITLVAYSNKGASSPAYIKLLKKNTEHTAAKKLKNIQNTQSFTHWIWVALLFAMILLTAILAFKAKIRKGLCKLLSMKQRMNGVTVKYSVTDNENLKWELNETKLVLNKVVGAGAFGIVQKGWYSFEGNKKTEVAVKTLKARPSDEQITQFYNEIEIMKSVPHHQHIVYLIGVITRYRANNPLILVEYCKKGNLQSFLKNVWLLLGESEKEIKYSNINRSSDSSNKFYDVDTTPFVGTEQLLQSKDLLSFARQIVVGMEFLSSLKIIHRDLAARNILLTEDLTIKISDFGLSRDIYTSNIYQKVTGGKLPFRWMAIESLTHQVYTTESDVWSFGIVLWEIVTLGANPYPTVKSEDLIQLLNENYRMEIPINCSKDLYHIMLGCWQAFPSQRPTFSKLKDTFDKLLESEMQYISLEDARKLDIIYYENVKNNSVGLGGFSNRYIVQCNNSMLIS